MRVCQNAKPLLFCRVILNDAQDDNLVLTGILFP